MLKKLMMLLVIAIQIFLTASCGSVSGDGATSLFQTATVSFTALSVASTSTVTPKPNKDDPASKAALTITVVPYTGIPASPFTVRSMQYTYTQTQGGTAVYTVTDANAGLSFAPVLASGDIMDKLVTQGFAPNTTSLTAPWIFTVQATYTIVEDYSGKTRTYSVPLGSVRFI